MSKTEQFVVYLSALLCYSLYDLKLQMYSIAVSDGRAVARLKIMGGGGGGI